MKKFIILLSCSVFLFSCVNKIKKLKTENKVSTVEVVSFKQADIDESGDISKEEFENVQEKSNIDYSAPMWGFYGVIGMVGILLTLSQILNIKKKKTQ